MMNLKERIKEEYDNGYDLSKTVFKGSTQPINIVCPDHGVFTTTPNNLIYNRGCKQCRGVHTRGYPKKLNKGIIPKKKPGPKLLINYHHFYIHNVSGGFLKFGITSGNVESRRLMIESVSDFQHTLIFYRIFYDRKICASIERAIKTSFNTGVAPPGTMRDGSTETIDLKYLIQLIKIVCSFPCTKDQLLPDLPVFYPKASGRDADNLSKRDKQTGKNKMLSKTTHNYAKSRGLELVERDDGTIDLYLLDDDNEPMVIFSVETDGFGFKYRIWLAPIVCEELPAWMPNEKNLRGVIDYIANNSNKL